MKILQVKNLLRPFFLSRAGTTLMDINTFSDYINLGVSSIHHAYNWSYKHISEKKSSTTYSNGYYEYDLSYRIASLGECYDQDGNLLNLSKTSRPKVGDTNEWEDLDGFYSEDKIYLKEEKESIDVTYTMEYSFLNYMDNALDQDDFILPDKFILPFTLIVYDLASPLSYFEDDQYIPRYQIAERRLNELKDSDMEVMSAYLAPSQSR